MSKKGAGLASRPVRKVLRDSITEEVTGGVILLVAWCGNDTPNVDRYVLPLTVMASFWNVSAANPMTGRPK